MQSSLPGTLYLYQGEELGMRNAPISWGAEEYKDIESVKYWKRGSEKFPSRSVELFKAHHFLRLKARDNARTPMQWDSTADGGFCPAGVKPWMRVNDDCAVVNAAVQRHVDLLVYDEFETIRDTPASVFAFRRKCVQEESITILNFSGKEAEFALPAGCEILFWALGSYDALSMEKPKAGVIRLLPWDGLLEFVQDDIR
ncbi:hypothetical protein GE09DRAFT_1191868 [Coniochaeta sp. 2T2.1]|nr:hypothetical protein GE09DRAFT_1191868 [Coniochaeta sp. 2T2.1]